MTAQLGQDAVQRHKELKLALQNQHPDGNADAAFGDELVRRWRRDHGGLLGAPSVPPIALAMIAAPMGANLDFQNVAIGSAGDFLKRLLAIGAASLLGGQSA